MIPASTIDPANMLNIAEQIREALAMFARNRIEPALIGGLAVVAHQVVRATKDVDFLIEAEAADRVHDALLDLGYRCLYRSEDAANYVRDTEGLDLLYAHRPLARRLLSQAHAFSAATRRCFWDRPYCRMVEPDGNGSNALPCVAGARQAHAGKALENLIKKAAQPLRTLRG
jgi:hypothetical protein